MARERGCGDIPSAWGCLEEVVLEEWGGESMALEEAASGESTQRQHDEVPLTVSPPVTARCISCPSWMQRARVCTYLTQDDESLEGAVYRELRVAGSDLVM